MVNSGPSESVSRAPFLLIGLSILLTVALVFVLLVPVSPCRDCLSRRIRLAYDEEVRIEKKLPASRLSIPPCERCRDRTKITLFNKWFGRTSMSY